MEEKSEEVAEIMANGNNMLEAQYVNDWIKTAHPTALVYPRMRVGAWPGGNILAGVTRVFPDKIFIENNTVFIVEAKTAPDSRAIGQVELYADLFPATPEFYFAKDLPVKKIFLTTRPDPMLEAFAAKRGVEYVIYSPEWLKKELEANLR